MKKEEILLDDFYRILHGQVPYIFYIELIIRTLFVFLVLTYGMRLLGKRYSATLTRTELAATSTLAAATGLVILAPERGLVPPLIIIGIIAGVQYLISRRSIRSRKFAYLSEGHLSRLVGDGTLDLKAMNDEKISKLQLFAELRSSGIRHLGEISRFYLEADGSFSLVKNNNPRPGLTIIPSWDKEFIAAQEHDPLAAVCASCGHARLHQEHTCSNCKDHTWWQGMK